jgi:hypothetical protein
MLSSKLFFGLSSVPSPLVDCTRFVVVAWCEEMTERGGRDEEDDAGCSA